MSLKGQVVLITGGCKNLSALIVRLFAAECAELALHYNSSKTQKEAEELAATLNAKIYQGDLTAAVNVRQLFQAVVNDFGRINIVINTVGMVLKKALTEVSEDEYDHMFAVNSKAAFFITQEAAKNVKDGGKIINILTSLLAVYTPLYTSYQGSKAPVEWFTKGLSKELLPRGISVNAIAPGPMDTPFFYPQELDGSVAFFKTQAIGGRLTKIEDIAPIVKFLCTEGAWMSEVKLFSPTEEWLAADRIGYQNKMYLCCDRCNKSVDWRLCRRTCTESHHHDGTNGLESGAR